MPHLVAQAACLPLSVVLISSPVTVLHEYPGLEVSEGHVPWVLMASTMLVLPISVPGEMPCSGLQRNREAGEVGN